MINSLPSEIIYNILSFLTYDQVYGMRGVCKKLQTMGESHIYHQIRTLNQTIVLKLDESKNISMKLVAKSYDPRSRVIEFVPVNDNSVSLANGRRFAYHRLLKIHFSSWKTAQSKVSLDHWEPQDRDLFLYHHAYNSSMEKVYELPCWNTTNRSRRYIGDKGLIVSMSYNQSNPTLVKQTKPIQTLPTSYSGYPKSPAALSPIPAAPTLEIKWIRVTLDWVISGLNSSIPTTQIYDGSFIRLNQMLAREGYFKYDPLSEPVLDYIVSQQDSLTELPKTLLSFIHSHTHECRTRLSRLQHMLEGAGVDAQMLWKYTFAKSFVVGSGSLLGEEDVVRRIQDSEEEWRQKKPIFVRKLKVDSH